MKGYDACGKIGLDFVAWRTVGDRVQNLVGSLLICPFCVFAYIISYIFPTTYKALKLSQPKIIVLSPFQLYFKHLMYLQTTEKCSS